MSDERREAEGATTAEAITGMFGDGLARQAAAAEGGRGGGWTIGLPKLQGWHYVIPKDSAAWPAGVYEIVEVYYDGKWSVHGAGGARPLASDDYVYSMPVPVPGLPGDVDADAHDWRGR